MFGRRCEYLTCRIRFSKRGRRQSADDRSQTLDTRVRNPANKKIFNAQAIAAWQTAFGAGGIAGAYRTYMTNTILPQITNPPVYLTALFNLIKNNIAEAKKLPNVGTDAATGRSPGANLPRWSEYDNFAAAIDDLYANLDFTSNFLWEYSFSFTWNVNNVKRQNDDDTGDDLDDDIPPPADLVCDATTSMQSSLTTPTSSGTSSRTSSSLTTSSRPSSSPTSSSSRSTTTTSTTTQPPRVAAPDITINTPSATPDCVGGFQTWTLQAVASAPANAGSLKMFIPKADTPGTNWEFDLMPGLVVDPKTAVEAWQVGTSAVGPPIASGDGGAGMSIKWQAPTGASMFGHIVLARGRQDLFTDLPMYGI